MVLVCEAGFFEVSVLAAVRKLDGRRQTEVAATPIGFDLRENKKAYWA